MRKDGKSQYQLKKEKLQAIKKIIKYYLDTWEDIRNGKYPTFGKEETPTAEKIINLIWEHIKDE